MSGVNGYALFSVIQKKKLFKILSTGERITIKKRRNLTKKKVPKKKKKKKKKYLL